uniref:Uncharacterized protein n=1 Tax=Timema tahoe TaxID=61484 RepID=A0A7R9FIW3_9NEOP|nr:unnamed protein product [Timema tahoe]
MNDLANKSVTGSVCIELQSVAQELGGKDTYGLHNSKSLPSIQGLQECRSLPSQDLQESKSLPSQDLKESKSLPSRAREFGGSRRDSTPFVFKHLFCVVFLLSRVCFRPLGVTILYDFTSMQRGMATEDIQHTGIIRSRAQSGRPLRQSVMDVLPTESDPWLVLFTLKRSHCGTCQWLFTLALSLCPDLVEVPTRSLFLVLQTLSTTSSDARTLKLPRLWPD